MTAKILAIALSCAMTVLANGDVLAADPLPSASVIAVAPPAEFAPPPSDWEFTVTP